MAEPRQLSEPAKARPLNRRRFLSLAGLATGAALQGGVLPVVAAQVPAAEPLDMNNGALRSTVSRHAA
jgi:hypothetical protein